MAEIDGYRLRCGLDPAKDLFLRHLQTAPIDDDVQASVSNQHTRFHLTPTCRKRGTNQHTKCSQSRPRDELRRKGSEHLKTVYPHHPRLSETRNGRRAERRFE